MKARPSPSFMTVCLMITSAICIPTDDLCGAESSSGEVGRSLNSAKASVASSEEVIDKANELDKTIANYADAKEYQEAIKLLKEQIAKYQTAETDLAEDVRRLVTQYKELQATVNTLATQSAGRQDAKKRAALARAEWDERQVQNAYNLAKAHLDSITKLRELKEQRLSRFTELKRMGDEVALEDQLNKEIASGMEKAKVAINRVRRRLGDACFTLGTYLSSPDVKASDDLRNLIDSVMRKAKQDTLLFPIFPKCYPSVLCILCAGDAGTLEDMGAIVLTDTNSTPRSGITTVAIDFETSKPTTPQRITSKQLKEAGILWRSWRRDLEAGNISLSHCDCFVIFSSRTWASLKELVTSLDTDHMYLLQRKGCTLKIYRERLAPTRQTMLLASENVFYETGPTDLPEVNTKPFLQAIGLWMRDGELRRMDTAGNVARLQNDLQMLIEWGGELDLLSGMASAYRRPEEIPLPTSGTNKMTQAIMTVRDGTGDPFVDVDDGFDAMSGKSLQFGLKWFVLRKFMSLGLIGPQTAYVFDNGERICLHLSPPMPQAEIESASEGTPVNLIHTVGSGWVQLPEGTLFTSDPQYAYGGCFAVHGRAAAIVRQVKVDVPYAIIQTVRTEGQKTWFVRDERESNFLELLAYPTDDAIRLNYDNKLQVVMQAGTKVLWLERFCAHGRDGKRIPARFVRAKDLKLENAFCAVINKETGEKTYHQRLPGLLRHTTTSPLRAEELRHLGDYYRSQGRIAEADACFQEAVAIEKGQL